MKPVHWFLTAIVSLLIGALLPKSAEAIVLNGKTECMTFGGSWANGGGPARLGQCVLNHTHSIKGGETVELGPSVDLVIGPGGGLINAGELIVINSSRVLVRSSYLRNEGRLTVRNSGAVHFTGGQIVNTGTVFSEGLIEYFRPAPPSSQGAGRISNIGVFTVADGGILRNADRFMSYNGGQLIVAQRGRFVNRAGAYFLASNDLIEGEFINEAGGYIDNESVITVRRGGRLESAGTMELGSIGNPLRGILNIEQGGTVALSYGGTILSWHGKMNVRGLLQSNSGVVENFEYSTLRVIAPGVVDISGRGQLNNHAGATIDNNGSIVIGCFASWSNNGILSGNDIGRSLCYPWPINPPVNPFP